MDHAELQEIVDAIVANRSLDGRRPHELLDTIHRKRLPGDCFPIIEPLLHVKSKVTYKCAIDMVGKMKGAPDGASEAVEAAWERSWEHGVPQACLEAFRALLRIGGDESRLLAMIAKSMEVDNYAVHKECAEALMKLPGGNAVLAGWGDTLAGKCDCHLHQKLAAKIRTHLSSN